MTLRFCHAMLQVRDLDAALRFYCEVLGLQVADRHVYGGGSLAYLRDATGQAEIELLSETPWAFAGPPPKGRCHIAFSVPELTTEHTRLRGLGVEAGEITDYRANDQFQTRYFYIYDPEGNEIEILEARGRYQQRT